jgi:hypothetical protein
MTRLARSAFIPSARPCHVAWHAACIAVLRWACCKQIVSAALYFFAFISIGSLLAQEPLLGAQVPAQRTARARRHSAKPMITGTGGSQTGTASFMGNFETITAPSQSYFVIERQKDCSLTFITGDSSSLGMAAVTGSTPHYERVLHQLASLQTTDDIYANGCVEKSTGISSRPVLSVGTSSAGDDIFAAAKGPITGTVSPDFSDYSFVSYPSIKYASGIATGDLNGDGNGDLIAVNSRYGVTSSFISVMLGNADGTFQIPVNYATAGNYSVATVIDDVNGDGKLDVVAVSGDQQISVLLGNGDGTFQTAKTFAAPALPGYTSSAATPIVNLITADVNGDGKKDVICSNGLVLLGNGDGTFTAASAPAFPYFTDALSPEGPNLASGDVNKDGNLDLVLDNGSSISIWLGNGNGTFTQGSSYSTISNTGFITLSDLDGDGNLDIYTGLANNGSYSGDDSSPTSSYVLMGNGNGTFQGAPQIGFGEYTGNNLGDVTGSGTLDLITNTVNTPYGYPDTTVAAFTVQLGTGKGTFNPVATTITAPASFVLNGTTVTGANTTGASTFAVGDVNGDGKADLVFADNGIYSAPVYFTATSNGDGTFQAPVPTAFPQIAPSTNFDISNAVSGLQISNLKKGGNASLIFTFNEVAGGSGVNPYNQGFVVLPGNGNGNFQATPVITTTYSSTTAPYSAFPPQIVAIADLNGDGNPDLLVNIPGNVVTNFQLQNQLEVLLGNGDGTFKTPVSIPSVPDLYGSPVVADLNKDGKLDLAFLGETSAGQAEIVIALGNGDGTFATPSILDIPGGDAIRSGSLAAGDFNGDGNLDLALFDSEAFSGIFYGNGNGTFTSVNVGTAAAPNLVPQDLINLSLSGPAVAANLTSGSAPDILVGNTVLLNVYGEVSTTTTTPTVTVTPSPSSITTAQSTMVTVAVSGGSGAATPTGSVTLSSGTYTSVATTLSSGSAVITVPAGSLAAGTDTLTATYTPDSTSASIYNGATGTGSVTVTAPAPGFALSNGGNITVSPGATTANTSTVTVTPSGGFTGAVALTCAIAPAAANDPATCALAPASVTIAGATAGTSTLTLTTTAATTAALTRPKPGSSRWYAAGGASLACVLLFVVPARRRHLRTMLGMIVLFACLAVGIVSCGGGGGGGGGSSGGGGGGGGTSNPGTTAGTYTVTVTGTAGSTTQTTAVTLTVN